MNKTQVITMDLEPLAEVIRSAVYDGTLAALKDSGFGGNSSIEAHKAVSDDKPEATDDKASLKSGSDKAAAEESDKIATETVKSKEKAGKEKSETDTAKAAGGTDKGKAQTIEQTKITHDDLQKIAAAKVKAKKGNTEKIGALIQTYGVTNLKDLPEEKFEQFLTDLNEI